ncbi:MAG: hypothetical protein ACR2H5_23870 [Ktedonobacteraceae bacterium]
MQLPTDPQPPKKMRPLGKALDWTEADITELSQITGHDKQAAQALWANEAPARFKSLLMTQETKEGK